VLANWWREDPQRTRLLSAILVDLDRFSRINQRLGTRSGDRTIGAIARLVGECLAVDRGCERLVRLGGQTLLMVLGDSGPRQALTMAERLRQAIEATTFDEDGTEFELTVSCGVVEVDRADSVADVVRRSLEALKFAKKSGRNRCALDEGQGPTVVDPPQFPVKGRIVQLDALPGAVPTPTALTSPLAPAADPSATSVMPDLPVV
jgi:diguanylate cyclase